MSNRNGLIIIGTAVLLMLFFVLFCTNGSNKIPNTTSSAEALEKYFKGRELLERFRNPEASEYFEDAIKIDSNFAMAHLLLSFTQSSTQNYIDHINKAISLMDIVSDAEQLILSAQQARMTGKSGEQEQILKELVELYPKDERSHFELANFYFGQQEFQKAIEVYKKCISINYRFSPTYNMLGYSHRNLGDFKRAEKSFEQYIKLIPDDPNPYDSYGELKMRMGKYGESIESYYKALKVNPKFTASHLGIAANLNFLDKHQEARDQLQELFHLSNTDNDRQMALFGIAVSYIDEGKLTNGIKTFEKRIKMSEMIRDIPSIVSDSRLIAYVLLEMNLPDKAEEKYNNAMSRITESDYTPDIKDNTTREIPYFMVQLALARNDILTAKTEQERYKEMAKEYASILRTRVVHEIAGIIALYEKNYNEAVKELELGREQSAYNLYRTALAYEGLGDTAKAIEKFKQTAYFNSLNDFNYSLIRKKAIDKYNELKN